MEYLAHRAVVQYVLCRVEEMLEPVVAKVDQDSDRGWESVGETVRSDGGVQGKEVLEGVQENRPC